MKKLDTVDKTVWGWGLELDDNDAKSVLEHFLWECQSELELLQKVGRAFNGPMTSQLVWKEDKRSVGILCDDHRAFSAEIKPREP